MAEVDAAAFVNRLERLYSHWEVMRVGINWSTGSNQSLALSAQGGDEESEELWGGVDALVVIVGKDDVLYSKSTTLQVSCITEREGHHSPLSRAVVAVWI